MFYRGSKNRFWRVIGLVSGAGLIFFVGAFWGYNRPQAAADVLGLLNPERGRPEEVDFAPFWEAWRIVEEKHFSPPDVQQRVWGAVNGLIGSLKDPYSSFLLPEEKKIFEEEINGNFGGIGAEIGVRDNFLTVIAPLKDTPAQRAGVLAGDKIVEIDNRSTVDLRVDEAIKLIRGEVGTSVKLKLLRGENRQVIEITITRGWVNIPTIDTKYLPGGVFFIKLHNFGAASLSLFREAMREFLTSGQTKLILDLRGNPGGFLEAAVETASWFLLVGKPVVIEERADGEKTFVYRSRGYNVLPAKTKMVVLIDRGSASASEIVAAALAEHGQATLVGEPSFGKGSVQELIQLADGTALKITTARWLTPAGNNFSDKGLAPDVLIERGLVNYNNSVVEKKGEEEDGALKKALEILKQ